MDRRRFAELPEDLRSWPDRNAVVEFNEILLKACAKDLDRRYQTADEMRLDLELLQRGRSIKQKRSAQRYLRIVKNICAVAALLALSVAAIVTFLRLWTDPSAPSTNPKARDQYHLGDYWLRRDTKEGLEKALMHFSAAIRLDPKFTMAYNGLFEVYIRGNDLGLPASEVSANLRFYASKMMELAPNLAEAHAAKAFLDFTNRRWDLAEPRFLYAIKLNTNCAMAHNRYGFCLYTAGRTDKALEELQLADRLDSTRPRIKKNIGNVFYLKRQFHEAIAHYSNATNLEPRYPSAHKFIGNAYRALGNYTNAIDKFEEAEILVGKDPGEVRKYFEGHRRAYAEGGPGGYWLKCLKEAEAADDLFWQAMCQANLANYDRALTLLEQACERDSAALIDPLLSTECFHPIHTDPRFVAILKKIGFQK